MQEALSDERLVAEYLADRSSPGGRACVDELFRRYHARVALWCLRTTGSRDQAADLAQEVLLRAFESLPRFRGESRFSTWLYAIARHHCFHYVRSVVRAPALADERELAAVADATMSDPLADLEEATLREDAGRILTEALDEMERKVFVLHFGDEMPLAAITRVLKLENPSGAKAYVVSAKRKIERALVRWKAQRARPGSRIREDRREGSGSPS